MIGRAGDVIVAVVLLGAVLVASSCGDDGAGPRNPPSAGPRVASTSPSARPVGAVKRPITLAFAGDVHFEGRLRPRLTAPRSAIGPIASTLRQADLAMVNLESAITTGGTRAPGKQFTFRAPPVALASLRQGGVDVASMANNHGMDYMHAGLQDSLAAIRKSRFPIVGIGKDADAAYRPYTTTVKGERLAIVGATQVLDDQLIRAWTATASQAGLASAKDVPRLVRAVKQARRAADAVIVYLHWGQELKSCPLPRQRRLARALIRAGADVIVGGHAHVPLGGGYLKGRYVDYGLGNFVFSSANGATAASGVLELTLTGRKVTRARWRPATISAGLPRLLSRPSAQQAVAQWRRLRRCAALSATP